ncbi:MAG TPA: hypothetical protein VI300_15590, partial [Solirubrobacter sp.]
VVAPNVIYDPRFVARTVTFSASYTTGGEAVSATELGLSTIWWVLGNIKTAAGSVVDVRWDAANGKLIAMTAAGEVANATNLSALVIDALFLGPART